MVEQRTIEVGVDDQRAVGGVGRAGHGPVKAQAVRPRQCDRCRRLSIKPIFSIGGSNGRADGGQRLFGASSLSTAGSMA